MEFKVMESFHHSVSDSIVIVTMLSFLLRGVHSSTFVFTEESLQSESYLKGKEKYELFKRESTVPRYSACWTDALRSLEDGCRHLTDDVQHRLALKFSNCFLEKTGRGIYECSESEPISQCTGHMVPEAYNVYTEFFTHTQNICYFLQAQAWQEETEQTIGILTDTSAHVARQLENSSHLQFELMMKQNESIRNQEVLLNHGIQLKQTLESSTADVQLMLREFKNSTLEQKALIFEVFDRLTALQKIVMGEFTGFYSLIFYTVSVLVCYLLTSTPRTSGARFWLFLLMTMNIIMERVIVAWGSEQYQDASTGTVIDESTQLYGRLWWCRKFFSLIGVAVWLRCAIKYKDLNQINNELLVDIRKQNSELKHLLQTGSPKPVGTFPEENHLQTRRVAVENCIASPVFDVVDAEKPWNITSESRHSVDKDVTTGYETESESGSPEASFNTIITDHTFTVRNHSESDTESHHTHLSHACSLQDQSIDLTNSTPSYSRDGDISSLASPGLLPVERKRGKPRQVQNRKYQPKTTVDSPSRYNLRSRAKSSTPTVNEESPDNFGKMVRHLAAVSKRNKVKAEATVGRGQTNFEKATHQFFSSDED